MAVTKEEIKQPLSLRLVRGDEHSVSISGRQFRLWPPGRVTLSLILLIVIFGIGAYTLTFERLQDYDRRFLEQEWRMESYRQKVMRLEANLIKAQELMAQVAEMAGVEYELTPLSPTQDSLASERLGVVAGEAAFYPRNLSIPFGLPLEGFVTRQFQDSASGQYHPGIDIAVGEGAPALATASGEVIFAGEDDIYGLMVILRHNDSLTTLYGHNSKLLVSLGAPVIAGARVALSGNTGVSSAPHLHYEVRLNNRPVDPMVFLGGID
ncbi:MAG: M23 family metallopeptidase [Candidatus Zixiibacteriota bacterium]